MHGNRTTDCTSAHRYVIAQIDAATNACFCSISAVHAGQAGRNVFVLNANAVPGNHIVYVTMATT